MNEVNVPIVSGEKPRSQRRLPQGSFVQADQWMDYLGYEQYCWWMKFHSWVNRTGTRYKEQHIPYTLESIYEERLNVSKTTFYRKIKVLWECGLIDIIEYEPSERKSQKPKNIIVYEYPFNDAMKEYLPLQKLRDWKKDYDSESKKAGMKGGLMKKFSTNEDYPPKSETVEKTVDNPYPPKIETVEKTVDNSVEDGFKIETVDGFKNETVTVSELVANNVFNNLLMSSNNLINVSNNSFVNKELNNELENSLTKQDLLKIANDFYSEFAVGRYSKKQWVTLTTQLVDEIIDTKVDLTNPVKYIYASLKNIAYHHDFKNGKVEKKNTRNPDVPFYNWLEQ
jgi:hypothetical protein